MAPSLATGIVREYIEGHPLARQERVPDAFHSRLRFQIDQLHARGMAYVDLEKCENVLVGDDGQPYLIDFQISWYLPARWGGELWPASLPPGQAAASYEAGPANARRPGHVVPQALVCTCPSFHHLAVHLVAPADSESHRPQATPRRAWPDP